VLRQTLIAERPAQEHHLDGKGCSCDLGGNITLHAPDGLYASVQLASAPSAARSSGASAPPAPILLPSADVDEATNDVSFSLQPVTLAGQLGSDEGLSRLLVRGTDFTAITAHDPLRIETPLTIDDHESLLACAWDGQDYVPVGFSASDNRSTLLLSSLPTPLTPPELPEARRNLAGAL
jgi:hypothetical protein